MQVYIAGIMQGSREDDLVNTQDYRSAIAAALEKKFTNVSVIDPFAMYPESINYDMDKARRTFEDEITLAAEADVLIAYLPEASMGTAIEMWVAHKAGKRIFAVTPLMHNWVIRLTADEVFPDLESLLEAIEDGRLGGIDGSVAKNLELK